jgi:nucleoid DNA-binding protein
MTKLDLAHAISRKTNGDHRAAMQHIEAFMECVSAAVAKGERVDLRGFGSFEPIIRKGKPERMGKHFDTLAYLPERKAVRFKPSDALTNRVRQGPPPPEPKPTQPAPSTTW